MMPCLVQQPGAKQCLLPAPGVALLYLVTVTQKACVGGLSGGHCVLYPIPMTLRLRLPSVAASLAQKGYGSTGQ